MYSDEISPIPAAPTGFKSGFIGIIGRPNVGKSTIMNYLVGQKIAITSPIAQTTRNRLRGILTTPESQIIFVDTPGIHKPHHELGKVLVKNAQNAIKSVDLVLFVVDSSVDCGGGDRFIAEFLGQTKTPVILGLNKQDQQPEDPQKIAQLDRTYQEMAKFNKWAMVKFSAITGNGLDNLLSLFKEKLPNGPYYYPPDLVTDQPERFIMGELIREQILHLTREEIPHSVAVGIEQVEESPEITRVLATIYVERNSQKGILIGRKGSLLKEVGIAAREQMQKLIDGKVYLEMFVKVQPKWRQSRHFLTDFGYRIERN
jgi:GTP-binding protein Era